MKDRKIWVGSCLNLSKKTSSEKTKAYQEEAGDDYLEVKAELECIARAVRAGRCRQRTPATRDQEMCRDLQAIFCKGHYRSWRPQVEKTMA